MKLRRTKFKVAYIYFKRVIFQIDSDFTMLNTQSREKFVAHSQPRIFIQTVFFLSESHVNKVFTA